MTVLVHHMPGIPVPPVVAGIDWLRSSLPDSGASVSQGADTASVGLLTADTPFGRAETRS